MSQDPSHGAPRLLGLLGTFDGPQSLTAAARQVRSTGFTKLEAYSPFPIHGIDDALGIAKSKLPWIVLGAAVVGGVLALLGQWWTAAVDYPLIISGKPLFALPPSVPVAFEVIILFGAMAAFAGMLALAGLPRFYNPITRTRSFQQVTTDGFVLLVQADGDDFDADAARRALEQAGATSIEECREEAEAAAVPRVVYAGLACLVALALLPPLFVARARATTSDRPPLRTFKDMDFQPKYKAQTTSPLFADNRAMRPAVPGTVARGRLYADDRLYRGIDSRPDSQVSFVATQATEEELDAQDAGDPPRGDDMTVPEPDWVESIPLAVTDRLMQTGQQRYNTFCAACHGRAGDGNGAVSVRALALEQGTWVPPTSIHADHVREQPVGKLFNTITHGVRKMPGYGDAMTAEDRWAVVLYLRALQRTRAATVDDLPAGDANGLRELN